MIKNKNSYNNLLRFGMRQNIHELGDNSQHHWKTRKHFRVQSIRLNKTPKSITFIGASSD